MAISKKLRFEIFKRDGFKCAYCGQHPPYVVLEIDHITPKSKKGSDDINNLITACFDCNRGKRDNFLSNIPSKLSENIAVIKEKESQYKEYQRYLNKIKLRVKKDIDYISGIYEEYYEKYTLTDNFKETTLKHFLKILPREEVEDAMRFALLKCGNKCADGDYYNRDIKYFCGICWNKIKEINKRKEVLI